MPNALPPFSSPQPAPAAAGAADLRLSPHFCLSEFTLSQAAARLRLSNEPQAPHLANLKRLAWVLEDVRQALGNVPVVISSGFRSPAVNAAVGGAQNPPSAHLTGRAADFTAPGFGTPRQICERIVHCGIAFDQLIWEHDWVHLGIAYETVTPRQQVLTAHFEPGSATRYTPGLA